ncbi:hypothetical protein BDR06DRAFT_971917 [Suillus hirtellus]|nr:hypothetical protein BDR06DRAFT_971917 [Suillus hirtellus]
MFSIYGSNVDRDSPAALCLPLDKDPIAWWGAYVPLESWTPPKLRKSKFKGVVGLADYPHFKKYNLENEFPAGYENTDDPIAKRDQAYKLCFNDHWDEFRSMLSRFTANNTGRNNLDPQDCAWDNPSLEGDNLYDCGWDDPMDHQFIMESKDQYDCRWGDPMDTDKPSTAVMAEQHCGDVNPSVAKDPYHCRWDAVANSYLNNILPTDEVDRDQMPAVMQMANQNVLRTYVDTVIKVTEPSEDVATIHHFLNVQCWIIEQLDNMIAICERDGWAT